VGSGQIESCLGQKKRRENGGTDRLSERKTEGEREREKERERERERKRSGLGALPPINKSPDRSWVSDFQLELTD